MARYLDQTGLKHFWKRIKERMPGPLMAYPVGSIYMTIKYDFDPRESFGGSWEKIEEGRCLIQAGGTYKLGSTGGEFSHQLALNEMPSHKHNVVLEDGTKISTWVTNVGEGTGWHIPVDGNTYGHQEYITTYAGGTNGHNNMQPYLAVMIWKRTA